MPLSLTPVVACTAVDGYWGEVTGSDPQSHPHARVQAVLTDLSMAVKGADHDEKRAIIRTTVWSYEHTCPQPSTSMAHEGCALASC